MNFNFYMPTKIHFGSECVLQQGDEFSRWGVKALLVTGRHSAKASGALDDVVKVLTQKEMQWKIFDKIEENPTVESVAEGGAFARAWQPDVVVAIGGGSPLDAAKAIATLAVNDVAALELFGGKLKNEALPIIAIPLTAGTGSEVTPYSVLTDASQETKRSFSGDGIFPKAAFLDARYSQSQSRDVTVNTVIDALSHSVEGYLSNRATALSDSLALEAIRHFAAAKQALKTGTFSLADRESLLYASMLGGMVIAQTGTTAVHAMGYSLTYFHQVPHGRANGLLLGEYLRFNEPAVPEKIANVLQAAAVANIDEFKALMSELLCNDETYTAEEMKAFAAQAGKAKNIANTPRQPNVSELEKIFTASLQVK